MSQHAGEKLCYLLWSNRGLSPAQRRETLLDECAPAMLKTGIAGLQMNIADDLATTPSPAPTPPFSEPFIAHINVWPSTETQHSECEDILRHAGFELHGFRVDEWLYTEYGENPNAPAQRDWPDGERSPGILSINILRKPKRVSREKWMQRWFGVQSPMSEWMQPRGRYVRNVVEETITPGADWCDGIVEESWPSDEHVTNQKLFYGAKNNLQFIKHFGIMMKSVVGILNLWNITTVMTSEYFVKTPAQLTRNQSQ